MDLTTSEQLLLTGIKQVHNLPYSIDSVMKMSHRTIFGIITGVMKTTVTVFSKIRLKPPLGRTVSWKRIVPDNNIFPVSGLTSSGKESIMAG
jgi:hypothetical protein